MVAKVNTRSTSVLKRPSSANESKVLSESNANAKINTDPKNTNVTRSISRPVQPNINRTKPPDIQANNVNNENNIDGVTKKNTDLKKDIETAKNQINANLNKNSTTNNIR